MALGSSRFALVPALLFATAAWGHHSHSMYEPTKEVTLAGTVKELQWNNPHVVLYIVVLDEDGRANNWALESGSPVQLREQGWPRDNPKPGDNITVTIRPLKAGARGGLLRTVTFADRSEFIYGGGPDSGLRNNRPPR